MTEFTEKSCALVKGFFDPLTVSTISQYLEYSLKRYPSIRMRDRNSNIIWYANPLTEIILRNYLPEVEAVTGLELYPTYSFARVYEKGASLRPHTDREACEVTVSCNIAVKGAIWPLYVQPPGEAKTAYFLEPGDACVYRGCEAKHWRDKAVDTDINVQVMLHYVDKNGPNASHKFDGRSALGLDETHRS